MTTPSWAERYSRQILLKEIGGKGQRLLAQARVGIVGAGPAGRNALLYLAAAGVGELRVADAALPVAATSQALSLNPTLRIVPDPLPLAPSWMAGLDLILACDHPLDRLNPMATQLGKPLLATWITHHGTCWIAGSRAGRDRSLPCLACPPPPVEDDALPPDPAREALATLWHPVAGTILAGEALMALLDLGKQEVWTTLLAHDALHGVYQRLPHAKDPHCPVCAHRVTP
ncbi:MAG: ThiF family adenylyltransferase [Magnetococcales bacterium]|nr:ThiF family adenylyltransferase [Magnetococcales bacterium]